jgi:hypothetical protein
VLIPRPDGHPTWFIRASAADLAGSRTDLPHCTPRRQIGAVGARDWLQLSEPMWPPGSPGIAAREVPSSPPPTIRPNRDNRCSP